MPERITALQIKDKVASGEMSPQDAVTLFRERPHEAPIYQSGAFISIDHERHYRMRVEMEEKTAHIMALIIAPIVGIADGALESLFYAVSELAEDVAWGTARIAKRVKEGTERGRK